MGGEGAQSVIDDGLIGWLRANRQRLAARILTELPALRLEREEAVVRRLDTLGVAVGAHAPELFVSAVGWDKVRLVACGGAPHALARQLEVLRHVLERELPPARFAMVGEILDHATRALDGLPSEPPSELDPANPYAPLCRDYLDALFAGDWRRAGRLVIDAGDRGVPIEALYLDVLQVAQREVGRLWQLDRISVAEEHYATAVTRQVLALLQPRIFTPRGTGRPRIGHTLIAAAVAGEVHELAARMVADFFDLAGWDTFFLGASTPLESLIELMVRRRADAVALSASLIPRVPTVAAFVRAIRGRAELAGAIILVGGHPFEIAPRLWQTVGADGSARSAAEAVTVGARLVASRAGAPDVH
jgi:methanogenic corrinoid protein MtbC1